MSELRRSIDGLNGVIKENKHLPKEYREKLEGLIEWQKGQWGNCRIYAMLQNIKVELECLGLTQKQVRRVLSEIKKHPLKITL